jgi:hypothetical protein
VAAADVGAFVALSFLISWSCWIPDALAGGHRPDVPGLLDPALAALVVLRSTGRRAAGGPP